MDIYEKINQLLQELFDKSNELKSKEQNLIMPEEVEKLTDEEIDNMLGDNRDVLGTTFEVDEKMKKNIDKGKYRSEQEVMAAAHKELMKAIARKINDVRMKENETLKAERSKIKSSIGRLKDLIELIKKQTIDVQVMEKMVNESNLDENIKNELISDLSKYALEKNNAYEEKRKALEKKKLEEELEKERIIVEQEKEENKKFDIKNYDFVEKVVNEYENIFPNSLFDTKIEEIFTDNEDLLKILKLHYSELDDETFEAAFISLLSKIDKSTSREAIELYVDTLNNLCKKFELISSVNIAEVEIKKLFSYDKITEEETRILMETQDNLNQIKSNINYTDKQVEEILTFVNTKLRNINSNRIQDKLNEKEKVNIKSFILFDYKINDENEKVPYVLTDYDENSTRCLIDRSLDRSKIVSNGYVDFNELIDDLIINGEPSLLNDQNDKLSKLVRPVYYTSSSYDNIKKTMDNATGMYRIRPTITSYLRFIDEKITIDKNLKDFDKIVDIFESKLKNVEIDRNSSFNIYINYLDAFKLDDLESYRKSINRQDRSKLRELLKKDKFSDDDLKELSDVIDLTLDSYNQLKQLNNNFEFKTINKITNGMCYTI